MIFEVNFIHPQNPDKPDTMLVWSSSIICVGKFPINVLRFNPFTNTQEAATIDPPEGYYTLMLDSQSLPVIFIDSASYFDIRREQRKIDKYLKTGVIE